MKANTSGYQVRDRFHVRNGHPVSTASTVQNKQKKSPVENNLCYYAKGNSFEELAIKNEESSIGKAIC
jgi:hypothetical protein